MDMRPTLQRGKAPAAFEPDSDYEIQYVNRVPYADAGRVNTIRSKGRDIRTNQKAIRESHGQVVAVRRRSAWKFW